MKKEGLIYFEQESDFASQPSGKIYSAREKRCPFCGGKDSYMDDCTVGGEPLYFRVCRTCGAEGPPHPDQEEAERRWNTRVFPQPVRSKNA